MDEFQTLKAMICSFRVADLQSLMTSIGRQKQGKKGYLQARALELLTNSPPDFDRQLYSRKIREFYKMAQDELKRTNIAYSQKSTRNDTHQEASVNKPIAPPAYQRMHSYPPYEQVPQTFHSGMMYTGQNAPQQQQTAQSRPNVPMPFPNHKIVSKDFTLLPLYHIKFSELPYFGLIEEITKPTELVCTGAPHYLKGTAIMECKFSFTLSCNAANEIARNRDMSKTPPSYPIQVLLRFCTYEREGVYDDFLPTALSVKLNEKSVALPPGTSNTRSLLDLKRAPLPINLNQNLKISPVVKNDITIHWVPEQGKKFGFSLSLVRCYKSQDLLENLKNTAVIPVEKTKMMISERFLVNALDDDVVATTNLKVSMQCPLRRTRLVYPARGRNCNHLQCFDAFAYISLNEKRTSWLCPVCNKILPYRDLFLDQYSMDILASSELSASCEEVQFLMDGTWKCCDEETEISSNTKKEETMVDSVEIILDDKEETVSNTECSTPRTFGVNENNNSISNGSNTNVIDLTDDDLVKEENEAIACDPNNLTALVEEFWRDLNSPTFNQAVSSSGYISPRSIISLDNSPSPPVLS